MAGTQVRARTSAATKPRTLTAAKPSPGTDSRYINLVNIGLILISFVIALYLPFKLFLFVYAILGPGHYLTEISWLQKRKFFTKGSYDAYVLAGLAAIPAFLALFSFGPLKQANASILPAAIGLAFGCGLLFFLTESTFARVVGLAVAALVSMIAVNTSAFVALVLAVFVPTLIHVYIFTGFFMIFGALKERSVSGYVTFGFFLVCPLLYFFIHPIEFAPSNSLVQSYWRHFAAVNTALLGLGSPHSQAEMDDHVRQVFSSEAGLIAMRFIAFAYTYHYLNWFSKTGIIKWHQTTGRRLSVIGMLWAASIVLYLYDYTAGIKVLFGLSLLHVFLEFPLNHMSIIGVFRALVPGRSAPATAT